jgi:hypothetical protein
MHNIETNHPDFESLRKGLETLCSNDFNGAVGYHNRSEEEWAEARKICNSLCNAVKNRFEFEKKTLVRAIDINDPVIDRRLLEYCEYVDGRYRGYIYVDSKRNIFRSLDDVKSYHGDKFVLMNNRQYAESVFIPELDCIVIMTAWIKITFDPEDLDKCSVRTISNPDYLFISRNDYEVSHGYAVALGSGHIVDPQTTVHGLLRAAQEMYGLKGEVFNIGGNQYITIKTMADFIKYVKYKAKSEHKGGKIQNRIDELVAMHQFIDTPNPDRMPHEYNALTCKTNINKIDDSLCVIRWTYSYRDQCFDGMRVYIDGKDVYACKRNNDGQLIRVTLSTLNQKNFSSEYETEIVMDDMSGTRLEWYSTIISTLPKRHRLPLLMTFLTDVKLEQLVKFGFATSICHTMDTDKGNIGNVVRNKLVVNKEHENSKNIYRWIGMSKGQLAKIREVSARWKDDQELLDIIQDIKKMFNKSDISDFDNEFFDKMLDAYINHMNDWRRCRDDNGYCVIAPRRIKELIQIANDADESGVFADNMRRYIPDLLQICDNSRYVFGYYYDFVDMVNKLGIRKRVKLYPETVEDLHLAHDNTRIIFNMAQNEIKRKDFDKHVAEIRSVEYEGDDFDFCVQAPKCPEDIAVEGVTLSHCVKTYIDRVCNGNTNILFIRKKDDRKTPFFTVELTTDRRIVQVRGFGNRGMDTEPNMKEFVQQWAQDKKLKVGYISAL